MNFRSLSAIAVFLAILVTASSAQKPRPRPATKARPIVFAVLNDGKIVEPIAYVDKGKLEQAIDNAAEAPKLSAFNRSYYKPASTYRLIFGGADAGSVTIKSSDPKAECIANTASIGFTSQRAKLKGNVMALATNVAATSKASGVRRLPTPAERSEIEALVRAELDRQKINSSPAKNLKYHNLTALDVDADGNVELVGTFWVETDPKTRALLFFIANKGSDGKYAFGATDFRIIEEKDVMSGEISAVDGGVYHERLLDALDIDSDGAAEVFTYVQSFEGAGFNAYRRAGGKWTKIYDGANYHCGY
jgi:hypothetical protein